MLPSASATATAGLADLHWPNTTPNGTATMTVRATDIHGHATEMSRKVIVDNDAPVIGLDVANGADVCQNFLVKAVSVREASGLISMTPFSKTLRDGQTPAAPSWSTSFGGTRGWHTFTLAVADKAGNTAWIHRRVYLDDRQPTVVFRKAPKSNSRLGKTVTTTAKATDNRTIARVQPLVNGKIVATDTRAGYTFTLNPKRYGKKFTVQLRAYDKAGNVRYSGKRIYRR